MQAGSWFLVSTGRNLRCALTSALMFVPLAIAVSTPASAQDPAQIPGTPAQVAATVVPQQIRFAAKLPSRPGETLEAVFRIYAEPEGGEPLWTEAQRLTIAEDGSYSVLLGAATPGGLPQKVFAAGAARWLSVSLGPDEDAPRVPLSSVPYAMKSADAESLSGHAASDFVTQAQLAQFAQSSPQPASPSPAITPDTSGTVTGSGTTGTVPLWTGSLTQGNSAITQVGSDIGINETAPTATLDVNGSENLRGLLSLPPVATATATTGQRSQLLQLSASAWSSTAKAPVTPTFKLLTNFLNNDTASPQGQLEFHYQNGTASVNVLSIAGNGVISFAPAQTFPGTLSSIAGGTGIEAATAGGKVTLSIDPTVIPTLSAANSFAGNDSFTGNTTMTSTNTRAALTVTNGDTTSGNAISASSDKGIGVLGQSYYSNPGDAGVYGYFSIPSASANTLAANWASGVWGDAATQVGSASNLAGVIGTADAGSAGYFANNSSTSTTLSAVNNGTGVGLVVSSNGGSGLIATANNGTGIAGYGGIAVAGVASQGNVGNIGILGSGGDNVSSTRSSMAGVYLTGVWGDSVAPQFSDAVPAGIIGTSDSGPAAIFQNNAYNETTLYVTSQGGGSAGSFTNTSNVYPTLALGNGGSGGVGLEPAGIFTTLMASTPTGTCGIGGDGDLSCTGQVKSLVSTGGGARKVETYATQSTENWIEDYGTGVMSHGVALVKIDPAFAETISESADYHVFLTPNADAEALYVINRTANGFEVRESKGGTSSLTFDYKIVAKRRGYEAQRLKDVTETFNAAKAQTDESRLPHPSTLRKTQHQSATAHPPALSSLPEQPNPIARPQVPTLP